PCVRAASGSALQSLLRCGRMDSSRSRLDSALAAPQAARRMTDAARRWLDALEPAQRQRATWRFDDGERFEWHYRPVPREGLALGDMSTPQRSAAMALVDAALSARGAAELRAIIALEPVLGALERSVGRAGWQRRDPEKYWFALFGEPRERGAWAWRVGGHHVSVHVTVLDERFVAATPLFFGANPVTVP